MKRVKLVNKTRNVVLAQDARLADNRLSRLRGLIGRAPLQAGQGLIILPSQGIHTFFMSYPIDAIYVDSQGRVIRALEDLRPYRFAPINLRTKYVAELPAGTLKRTGTKVGDMIEIADS